MLLQIFILEACPDLKETRGDKKDTHTHTRTHSDIHIFPHGETADIWQREAEHRTASKSTPTPRAPCLPASPEASCHLSKDLNPLRHKNHLMGWHAQKERKKRLAYHANIAFSSSRIYSKGVHIKLYVPRLYSTREGIKVFDSTVAPSRIQLYLSHQANCSAICKEWEHNLEQLITPNTEDTVGLLHYVVKKITMRYMLG